MCHGINEILERFRKELLMFNGMERVTESEQRVVHSRALKREQLLCKKNTEHLNNLMWASETKLELASLRLKDCLE